jgi:hypothetical protein
MPYLVLRRAAASATLQNGLKLTATHLTGLGIEAFGPVA